MLVAEYVLWACACYLLIGLAVGVPFVRGGVDKVDAAAHGAPVTFRLLILPGCMVLWPVILQLQPHVEKGVPSS